MVGMPLEEALPKAVIKMDRQVHRSRYDYKYQREVWGAALSPGGGWVVDRVEPGPMPVPVPKPKAPRHKAAQPVLVAAGDLKAAWALTWMMDPVNAVGLVESARRVLGDPEQTRRWFHEGMGGSSLRFLLDLFWPNRTAKDYVNTDYREGSTPQRLGYKVKPGSLDAMFRRLLKALGRNDWQRAEATLEECRVRTTYYHRSRETGKSVKRVGTIKNGRTIRLQGVARYRNPAARDAHAPDEYKEFLTFGFKPRYAPSVMSLLELRELVTRRLWEVRATALSQPRPLEKAAG